MSIEIKVPNLPESVSDATVAKWHKKPGEAIARDENLVDLETDKVVLEVPAPADGILDNISAQEGDTVTEAQILGTLTEGAPPEPSEAPETEQTKPEQESAEPESSANAAATKDHEPRPVGAKTGQRKPARSWHDGRKRTRRAADQGRRIEPSLRRRIAPGGAGQNVASAFTHCRANERGSEHGSYPDLFQRSQSPGRD